MNKKILICVVVIVVIFSAILFSLKKSNNINTKANLSESQNSTNSIYDLMMNTVSRNIIGMDPSEMSSDEQEFYYEYLYEENEDMEMYYDEDIVY